MKSVRIHKLGGPEVLNVDEKVDIPKPGANEVLVNVAAAGVNFIDTYHRTGLYKVETPFILGREASGIVTEVGSEVKDVAVGTRVAFFFEKCYSEYVTVPVSKLIVVPDEVSLNQAAAVMLQGLTAHYLITSTHKLSPTDTVLIHAGAGGTGQLLIQMAKIKGAKVLTTVSSAIKAEIAARVGADHVLHYVDPTKNLDFLQQVKALTQGRGVDVVYDGVGRDTFEKSLKCCTERGHLVMFGNASGKVPPIDIMDLSQAGSITLTRPALQHYISSRSALLERCTEIFEWLKTAKIQIDICKMFPLDQAADAHRFLESRQTTGKVLLIVNDKLK